MLNHWGDAPFVGTKRTFRSNLQMAVSNVTHWSDVKLLKPREHLLPGMILTSTHSHRSTWTL